MIDYSWHQQLQENASTNAAAATASLYFSDILLPNILRVTNLDNWIFGEICTFCQNTNSKIDNFLPEFCKHYLSHLMTFSIFEMYVSEWLIDCFKMSA